MPVLAEMVLLAAFPPCPLPAGAAEMPRATRWTVEWGRTGDVGVVAWRGAERVGAAWCRLGDHVLAPDQAGRPLPELAIAVAPGHRSRGIGGALLAALERGAVATGHEALCLTVNARNPALRLYERAGYRFLERDGDRLTMTKALDRTPR